MDQTYYGQGRASKVILRKIVHSLIEEILTIASKKIRKKSARMVVLDVGSGYGMYTEELSRRVKRVVGVEPYSKAYHVARKIKKTNLTFHNCLIENYKSKEKFDLILSLTTLEHMPNAYASFIRIFALLKKHGIIYLTAPNKLWPIEPHYKLPFLSYLPLPISNIYLQIMGKGNSYEDSSYSQTYFGVQNFLRKFPCSYNFQLPNPSSPYLGMGTTNPIYHIVKIIGISLIRQFPIFWFFSKGFVIVIQKK